MTRRPLFRPGSRSVSRSVSRSGEPFSVLVVAHYFPPHIGGIEQVAHAEARGLSARGVTVRVLTSNATGTIDPLPDEEFTVVRVRGWNFLERWGVPFPLFFPPALLWHAWGEVRRADAVHVHDTLYMSSWVTAAWCRLLGKRLVVTQHVAVVAHPWRLVALAQNVVYATLARLVWSTAEVVFYMNGTVLSSLQSHGLADSALHPLPNGVDLDEFVPCTDPSERAAIRRSFGLPTDGPLVLFAGRLVPKKGYRRLIEATERSEGWTLVLAGAGERVEATSRVRPLGARDRAEMRQLYRSVDIFALPSSGEGFPLTIQEAMASGLPIVTTDDPGYAMYGLDRSLVALTATDSPTLAAVITALVDDGPRRAAMGRYSREFAHSRFSWERHVATLLVAFGAPQGAPEERLATQGAPGE